VLGDRIEKDILLDARLIADKDAELARLKIENKRLKDRSESLEKLALKLNAQNNNLRASNKVLTRRYVVAKERHQNLENTPSSSFRQDQITAMLRKSTRGMKSEPETLKDALVLKMKCGTDGYDEVRKILPFPRARALQSQVHHIKFESGISEEVFQMIPAFVKNLKEEEVECMLALDEMNIAPTQMFDPSTKKVIGGVTLISHDGIADKALVFVLDGVSTRWKQVVAYNFTRAKGEGEDKDAVGKELAEIIIEIVKRAEAIGLRVNCVTSDMGHENAAIWRYLGLHCIRPESSFAIRHPVRPNDLLCFVTDVPHLFKNLKKCF